MKRTSDNTLLAFLLIFCAVYLIASKLELLPTLNGIGIFDLLLTVFFLSILLQGLRNKSFGKIFFSVAFLGIIYDEFLGITALTPWTILLAALLLTIALNLLFPKHSGIYFSQHTAFGDDSNVCTGEDLAFHVTFGNSSKYINSDNFIHADCNCVFGELNVYLDDVVLQNDSANINIDVKFGEINIYVPKKFQVVCNVSKGFGDVVEHGHRPTGESSQTIYLNGSVSFGELNINYVG